MALAEEIGSTEIRYLEASPAIPEAKILVGWIDRSPYFSSWDCSLRWISPFQPNVQDTQYRP